MTKTEFYNQLKTNARLQGYIAAKADNGLKFNNIVVSIYNNVVTITDNNGVIDITDWKKHFIDNMLSITLDTVIKNVKL